MRNPSEHRFALLGATAIVVLAISGFGITEAFEYLTTAGNRISDALHDGMPVDVEIDRIQVILAGVDDQIERQKHVVATGLVALEDAESAVKQEHAECQALLSEMQTLRNRLPDKAGATQSTACRQPQPPGQDTQGIRRRLATRLAIWEARTSSLQVLEEAVEHQRQAVDQLTARHDEWRRKRELLSSRLTVLRTRQTSSQAYDSETGSAFDDAALSRATRLANEIETRLRVGEKASSLDLTASHETGSLTDIGERFDKLTHQ